MLTSFGPEGRHWRGRGVRVLCTRLLAGIPLGDGDGEESKLLHRFHCFADVMRWALLPSPSNNQSVQEVAAPSSEMLESSVVMSLLTEYLSCQPLITCAGSGFPSVAVQLINYHPIISAVHLLRRLLGFPQPWVLVRLSLSPWGKAHGLLWPCHGSRPC